MFREEKQEMFQWCDLVWKSGAPVMGGRSGAQRSQLQVRVRTSKCKDANAVIAQRKAYYRRVAAR